MNSFDRIKRKINKLRLQPIHVYSFHHVCSKYDAESMYKGDWMELETFKQRLFDIRSDGTVFISLSGAYQHISKDVFRRKHYSVITFDDGYASLKEVLPWMEQQEIPYTLFINGKYLDGVSYRNNPNEKYLTKDELFSMNSRFLEIGHHGWEHNDATKMSLDEFKDSLSKNIEVLSSHTSYVPFWAYTWGNQNSTTDYELKQYGIVPVLMDGAKNYDDENCIHRELLDLYICC